LTLAAQLSVAVVCVVSIVPAAGDVLMTQAGNITAGAAVVKPVVFAAAQLALTPLAFLGATYQLYKVPAVKPVTL